MKMKDLTVEQTRRLVDTEQVYEAWRSADAEFRTRYAGTMHWQQSGGREYLYRKIGKVRHSLGPRSRDTEQAYKAHMEGRARLQEILRGTSGRLTTMAPVNRALGLGRVPTMAARIIRRLDEAGLLGRNVRVTGTHALHAFERLCGVHVARDLVATGDVDPLYDHRSRLRLTVQDIRIEGVLGLLRRVDGTFTPVAHKAYRAANRDGFMVDLIMPPDCGDRIRSRPSRSRIGESENDLTAAEIGGLAWLVSSPAFDGIAIGENGYPLRMVCPDPRAWAVHKLWLSDRPDRDAAKRRRDREQGLVLIDLLRSRRPDMPFDSRDLSAVPRALVGLVSTPPGEESPNPSGSRDDEGRDEESGLRPDW